jgi:hypothetical protein
MKKFISLLTIATLLAVPTAAFAEGTTTTSTQSNEYSYEEFFDTDFEAIMYNNSMSFEWDEYTGDDFLYYKLVYSLENEKPVYPTDTTLKYYESSDKTSFFLDYRLSTEKYFALCVVTTDKKVDCTDGINPEEVDGDILFDVTKTAEKVEIPPAGFEDEVITTFDKYNNPFPDTDMSELEGQSAAELYRRAVLGGYPDGEFKGEREVNRAEAAKFLLFARLGDTFSLHTGKNGGFSDVLKGEWYARFVIESAERGIIEGYPDGLFKPAKEVNTVEFLKMLTLTFDLETDLEYSQTDVEEDAWYKQYVGVVDKYDLFPHWESDTLNATKKLSREDVSIAIYQYLTNR